jgi:hypothetical protein
MHFLLRPTCSYALFVAVTGLTATTLGAGCGKPAGDAREAATVPLILTLPSVSAQARTSERAVRNPESPPTRPSAEASHEGDIDSTHEASAADVDAEIIGGITEISPNEHRITRRAYNLLFSDQQRLERRIRVTPEQVRGKVIGLRVHGAPQNSIFYRLGLRDGDLLRQIESIPLDSPEHALEAYSKVHNASQFDIDGIRDSKPLRLVVHVD